MAYDGMEYDSGEFGADQSGQLDGMEYDYGDTGGGTSAGSDDVLFTYVPDVSQVMNAGFSSVNAMTGQDIPGAEKVAAPTNTGADMDIEKQSKGLMALFKWDDPRVQAAALTAGMGALSGAGTGYFASKKQEDANKIAQQQVDVNRQLAQSQEALNKSKTSQDLSKFRFQQPRGLIDSTQKPWQPAPFVSPTRRVSL